MSGSMVSTKRNCELICGHIRMSVVKIRSRVGDTHLVIRMEGIHRTGVHVIGRDIITEVLFGLPALAEKCGIGQGSSPLVDMTKILQIGGGVKGLVPLTQAVHVHRTKNVKQGPHSFIHRDGGT